MREHEQGCFAASSRLGSEAFRFVNVVEGVPERTDLDGFDALMIGGAGHFNVTDPTADFFEPLADLLRRIVEDGFPTFASCFGYQLLVHVLGGRVVKDPARAEVGSFTVSLTEAGARDEIFGTLPRRFTAQMGHKDRAVEMPKGIPNLAATERSPLQALRIPHKPIWATQFHPELDQRTNHDRYLAYIERYDPQRLGKEAAGFTSLPSPETSTLLPTFLDIIGQ